MSECCLVNLLGNLDSLVLSTSGSSTDPLKRFFGILSQRRLRCD